METHAPYDSSDEDELVYIGSVSYVSFTGAVCFERTTKVPYHITKKIDVQRTFRSQPLAH